MEDGDEHQEQQGFDGGGGKDQEGPHARADVGPGAALSGLFAADGTVNWHELATKTVNFLLAGLGGVMGSLQHQGEARAQGQSSQGGQLLPVVDGQVKPKEDRDEAHWPIQVERARVHKNMVIMKFEGLTDVPGALSLRNAILYIDRSDAKLPEGAFFLADIYGLEVLPTSKYCFSMCVPP